MHPVYSHIKENLLPLYPAEEASALARWILTDVFSLSPTELYTGKDINFQPKDWDRLEDILTRLRNHEPIQYILGTCSFCGLEFQVAPGVLIPRPETAELVDWIVSGHRTSLSADILDIGTGSGCIAISLAHHLKGATVSAWDISSEALRIARQNAERNQVRVSFTRTDILQPEVPDMQADIIVSNPPYITEKEREEMEHNVLDWEPEQALFVPDNDPLLFYRAIARHGLHMLRPQGRIYFEINRAYGKETTDLLMRLGYKQVELKKDFYGNDRMIKAIKP